MRNVVIKHHALQWNDNEFLVHIEPWGRDCIRVRTTALNEVRDDLMGALLPSGESFTKIDIQNDKATLINGQLSAILHQNGEIAFIKCSDSKELVREMTDSPNRMSRHIRPAAGDLFQIETYFASNEGERFYGLGQNMHGLLDQKGAVVDFRQQNTRIAIPFVVSSKGYGLLWNNPALGRVELGMTRTRWVADAAYQSDYIVMTGYSYAEIMNRYADLTGYPPILPEFASGFWQCKMRYANQEELLNVARKYKRLGLPLSVIVVDFMHWTRQGDWKWDPIYWPDPKGMIQELKDMDIELMASVWPTVNYLSENFTEMFQKRMLVRTHYGQAVLNTFPDTPSTHDMSLMYQEPALLYFYDSTNPEARNFFWSKLKKNYYDLGCRVFWLDACEPDIYPDHQENLRFWVGDAPTTLNLYPLYHQQAVYEGLSESGEKDIITLCRSGWAGSQRFGAAIWSGDITSTWEDLAKSVKCGLNMAMSGIPWWTTDIGGFYGGNINDENFRELIVRWFQYGTFCPLFRLHGFREPYRSDIFSGTDNEVWSFGDKAYEIIKEYLFLRERLRPYIMDQMRLAHDLGTPPMRPIFFDFPNDIVSYTTEDQFLFGPDLLIAPVTEARAKNRKVYLPNGADWTCAWTGKKYESGKELITDAPLNLIPVFIKNNAAVVKAFMHT